ncbi:MAG: DUF2267 domain-containing protein [Pseudomonadota bacterium]
MEELISRIVSSVGIDEALAQKAVGIILSFLNKEGPDDAVSQLMSALPGAETLLSAASDGGSDGGGGLMGALGGLAGGGGLAGALGGLAGGEGIMGAASELMGAGLDMDQIQGVTQQVVGFAKEKAGDEVVGQIVAQIPGMDQFG